MDMGSIYGVAEGVSRGPKRGPNGSIWGYSHKELFRVHHPEVHIERVKVDMHLVITSLYHDILPSHVRHHDGIYTINALRGLGMGPKGVHNRSKRGQYQGFGGPKGPNEGIGPLNTMLGFQKTLRLVHIERICSI